MKRFAALLLCLICAAALFGCGKKEPVAEPEPLPVKTASTLAYNNGSTTLRFSNSDGKWVWTDGPTFPLDDSTIQQILAELPKILATKPEKSSVDPAVSGLAEPMRYLTVTGAEGSQMLYFGNQTAGKKWYMRLADGDAVYLIPNDFMLLLSQNIYDMAILPTIPALTEENVTFIGVSQGEEKQTYFLKTDGTWKSNGKESAATAQKILQELEQIEILRCVDYFPAGGVAELCGLTEGATQATVKYMNSVGAESELVLTFGGEMETDTGRYITIGDSAAIYCLSKDDFKTLLSVL